MKKLSLITFTCVSLLLVGCSNNYKLPKYSSIIEQASINIDRLTNANFKDIENDLGSPNVATYYIDANKIKGKDINALTLDDIKDSVVSLASYKNPKEKNSYLHIYYENGLVRDAISGSYDLYFSNTLIPEYRLSSSDYKVEFFKGEGAISINTFNLENSKDNFLGKNITIFEKFYDIKSANFIASTIDDSDKLYFYPLVDYNVNQESKYKYPNYQSNSEAKLGYTNPINNNISYTNQSTSSDLSDFAKKSVVIYTDKNGNIKFIQISNNDFMYGLINKAFASNTTNLNSK